MIRFRCRVCRCLLDVHDAEAGDLVRCPHCGRRSRVPWPEAVPVSASRRRPRRTTHPVVKGLAGALVGALLFCCGIPILISEFLGRSATPPPAPPAAVAPPAPAPPALPEGEDTPPEALATETHPSRRGHSLGPRDVHVEGHYRGGHYVRPHDRAAPGQGSGRHK